MGEENLFQKYRLCLILSVMAVVLVASALLFLKKEEPAIEVAPESIEVTEVYKVEYENTESKKESEEKPDIAPESEVFENPEDTMVTEERVEPEQELMKEPVAVKEPEVSCHHSWVFESFYQEPTCSNGGLENQVCAHCGETQVTGGTPTGEHSYCVEVPGDCCSEEVVVCTECNHREIKEKDMGNHIDVEDGFCYGCGTTIK